MDRDGPSAVSLRALAREVGVSHAAPKNHFADKSALFAALAVEGFGLAEARFRAATKRRRPADAATARLLRGATDYVRFACERPGTYSVMWRPDLHGHAPEVALARSRPFRAWVDLLREAQGEGFARDLEIGTLVEIAWALVTGLVSLAQTARGPMGTPVDDATVELVLATAIERLA